MRDGAQSSEQERVRALFDRFKALSIETTTVEHEPVFTVEAAEKATGHLPGAHIKNLFLKDRKAGLYLIVALSDRRIDLKSLRRVLSARGNLSFGKPELLADVLGVSPGAVSPLALFNDTDRRVHPVLDNAIFEHALVHAHPLQNAATTALTPTDLERFLEDLGYTPQRLDFLNESSGA